MTFYEFVIVESRILCSLIDELYELTTRYGMKA